MSLTPYATDPLALLATRYMTPDVEPDPVAWAKDELGIDMYSMQRVILRLLEIVPKLAVPSCHDAGKSFIAALAAARFLAKYPPGTARVVSTAPRGDQVRGVLWNEINALHTNSAGKLPGRVNQTEWWIGTYQAGIGRKPSDYDESGFQGFHAEHILIIVDEAGGVPDHLWTGIDTIATNAGAVILAIGNPDDPQTEFHNIVKHAETPDADGRTNGWTVVKIPAWKTPNFSGEIVTPKLRNVLLSQVWVDDKRFKWGEDSALWTSKVEAEFPDESSMTVVRIVDVVAALAGPDVEASSIRQRLEQVQLGIDIAASETGDETIIRERRGNRLLRRWSVQSGEPEDVSDLIVRAQMESGATILHIDATGVGFGFLSDIRRRIPGVAVMPFIAAGRALDPVQFENRRAEAHWNVRDRLRRRDIDFSGMEHADETVAQLTSIRYHIKKGRIIVEPKNDVRKRIGRSPDDSDALLLAVLPPSGGGAPAPATVRSQTKRRQQEKELAHARETLPDRTYTKPHVVPERIVPPHATRLARSRRARVIVVRP
jgi:hypothetical protein